MADSTANIKVEIDTDEAQKSLNQLYETQKKLIDEMKGVDEGSEAYNDLAKTLEDTNKQIAGMERNIKTQTMGIDEMEDITSAASRTVANLGIAETKLGKIINTVAGTMGNLKNTVRAYKKAQDAANVSTNAGTKALNGMNKAAKSNVLIAIVSIALPMILTLVEKFKEAGSAALSFEDRLDNINKKYERINGLLSKLGADEITSLRVEQRRLNEEIKLTRTHYVNMMNKGEEVTEKMWHDLDVLDQKYKDMDTQIRYMNEDLAAMNKLLQEQADIDKDLTENQANINRLQKRLEIEQTRNGVTQKSLDLERDIYNLSLNEISLQEEKLSNEEKALDEELSRYNKRVDAMTELTAAEKNTAKSNKEKEISLQKQAIENQRITLESQKQLNILDRQLKQIQLVKLAAQQYANFMISVSEKTAGYNAQNIRDYRQMGDFYTFQNDVLKRSSEEIQKTMSLMSDKADSPSVNQFFKNYEALLKTWDEIVKGEAGRKVGEQEKKEIEDRFKLYQGIFETYSQQVENLLTHLETNVNNTLQATQNANDALITLYRDNLAVEADYVGQAEQFNKNIDRIMEVREMLKRETAGGSLSKEDIGWLNDNDLKNLYDSYKAAGDAGIQLLDDYMNRLVDMQVELNDAGAAAIVDMSQATMEFMSNAIIIGTANLGEYLQSQLDAIDDLQNQEEVALNSEYVRLMKINDARRQAGLDEINIEVWKQEKLLDIQNKYDQQRKLAQRDMYMTMLQQGNDFVQNMTTVFADLYEDNKDVQKATIVVSTLANAAMAFGSTFAQAAGGLAAKAAQAAAASAAVIASGISAYRKVDSANQSTTLEESGGITASSARTGSSSVSSTILERQIQPVNVRSTTDTVLVLSDVEYKQRQQQNVNKITVI